MATSKPCTSRSNRNANDRVNTTRGPLNVTSGALMLASMAILPASAWAGTSPGQPLPTLVGRTAATQPITVALTLPSRDPQGAQAFVSHVGTPGDPLFHHYLTPADYAARFGANQADYDAVAAWATSQGLTVGERYAGRTVISVTGSVSAMEKALGV